MSEERRPRSRFDSDDVAVAERPARSRFDTERRSRSPKRRESDAPRERSPVAREASDSPAADKIEKARNKAAAAAAAAARINAQIQAKKGIQHVDVPPIRAVSPLTPVLTCTSLIRLFRWPLLRSSSRPQPARARLSQARYTNKMVTSSRTLRSTICVIAIH